MSVLKILETIGPAARFDTPRERAGGESRLNPASDARRREISR